MKKGLAIGMTILLLMVLLRFCLPRDTEKNRRVFVSLVCVMLLIVAACRAPEVGRDTSDCRVTGPRGPTVWMF